ncbi:MAG TPA: DUF2381 family protein [Archangium sp.]|uniref:DUF2381 family protein n=1 Tax=Archangium sp. TaxID=1872627 RepID=UPI002E3156DD|nr:DUF2381 family protein [Archangium sp.]HEX5750075.1 DUF2381 family protein [Archangium sp.]
MMTSAIGQLRNVVLVALLVVSATNAAAHGHLALDSERTRPRTLYLSKDPRHEVPQVFVAGGRVSTLRFTTDCEPGQTKLLGWEGRFEPLLVGGRSVVIVPFQDLDPDDRFMLLVTLKDGTSLPFTVTARAGYVDGQVNVFPDPEAPEAVLTALKEQHEENEALRAENHRQREEGISVDHAIAALLANDKVDLTPFTEGEKWVLRREEIEVEILIFVPKKTRRKVAETKAGVVFKVTNKDPSRPWALQEARLSTLTTQQSKPFALRETSPVIAPGETGRIAIVTDLATFDPARDGDKLALELFRDGGLRQAYVELIPANLLR